jgi:hypothetical protein
VVKHLSRHLKVEGSITAATAGSGREKLATNGSYLIEVSLYDQTIVKFVNNFCQPQTTSSKRKIDSHLRVLLCLTWLLK